MVDVTTDRITAGATQTTRVFQVRGQMAQWRYPDAFQRLTPEYARKIRNMNLSERGSADVRRGYAPFNITQLTGGVPVVGLYQKTFPAHGSQIIVCGTDAVYTDNGTTRKDITNGVAWSPTADQRVQFAYLDRKVFMNNGDDQIVTWDGDFDSPSGMAALTGMPWTKARAMVPHKGMLVVLRPTEGGVDQTTMIRWNDINRQTQESDTGTWIQTNRTEIYEGGEPIIGGVNNWGRLWVFKEDGAYSGRLTTQLGRFEYEFMDELHGFEPIATLGLVVRPEFIFGVAREGAFVIRPDLSFEIVTTDNQSAWRDLVLSGRLEHSVAWIRSKDKQVRLLCSSKDNAANHDTVMVWDWNNNATWFDEPEDVMNYAAPVTVSNEELDFYGTPDGYLHKGNGVDVTSDNGTEINWDVDMSPNDIGFPNVRKMIIAIRVYIKQRVGTQIFNTWVELDQGKQASVTAQLQGGITQQYNTGLQYNSGLLYEGGTNQQLYVFVNRVAELVAPRMFGSDPIELIGYDVEWMPLE